MKTLTNSLIKCRLHHFTWLLAVSLTLLLASCGGGEKKTTPEMGQPSPGGAEGFTMNAQMLTRDQVQAWVDSGWTKPGSGGEIKDLILQFYTPEASKVSSQLQLFGYPGSSPTDVRKGGAVYLQNDTTSKAVSFSGPVIFGNNEVLLDKLNIFNDDGTLKEFDYIRFTPEQLPQYQPYITYKIEVVIKGQVQAGTGGTLPCPPYCCPPDCN